MVGIPLYQSISANFTQRIELNEQLVQIKITYNVRAGFFFMRLTDENENFLAGVKIVPNFPLLRQSAALLNFTGDFLVVQESENVEDEITYDNFGAGWTLYYITPDELIEWEDENGLSS